MKCDHCGIESEECLGWMKIDNMAEGTSETFCQKCYMKDRMGVLDELTEQAQDLDMGY